MKQVPFPGIAEPIGIHVQLSKDGRKTTVTLEGRLSDIIAAILQPHQLSPELFRLYEDEIQPAPDQEVFTLSPGGSDVKD